MARPLLPLLGVGGSAVAGVASRIGTPMGLLLALTYADEVGTGITFVGAGGGDSSINNITLTLPVGFVAGDIHLMMVNCNSNDTAAAPVGWTAVTGSPVAATTAPKLAIFWRRAQGGDTSVGVAEPTPNGDHAVGIIVGFRGCIATGDPWEAIQITAQNTASTSATIDGVTTLGANRMIVSMISHVPVSSTPEYSSFANVSLVSTTEGADFQGTSGDNGGVGMAYGIKTAAGVVSNTTVTLATSSRYVQAMLALIPV